MSYLDEIIENKISAKEILGAFNLMVFPDHDNTVVLEDDSVEILLGTAEKVIDMLRNPEAKASILVFASSVCNAFAAGMVAGMARRDGFVFEDPFPSDFNIKVDEA
jgi:hypothetical protein